jgi:hypothetical protein
MPIKKIESWRDFLKVMAGPKYRNWAFRGQRDATWPLVSSLTRYLDKHEVDPQAWATQEDRIFRIFRRKAHLFLEHVPDDHDAFQWLALMQHHGAPTRLLDFTWSPFVAAFLALEDATKDAAIWGVFIPAIWEPDRMINFPEKDATVGTPHPKASLFPGQFGLRNPEAYEKYYLGNDVPFVSSGEPVIMNKRLIAQSGTFVVPGVLDQPIDKILSKYPYPEKTIVKFVLRTRTLRDEAMRELYTMNLTNATLFPDLDGLAKSMAYELEFHWAYSPKTMNFNSGYEPRRYVVQSPEKKKINVSHSWVNVPSKAKPNR